MAYGRLDVYFPDGRVETHYLELPEVLIGSSEASTIRLESEGISAQHLSIRHVDGLTTARDLNSENGTFIDGQAINQVTSLSDTEEMQIGPLRLIFQPLDPHATVPSTAQETVALSLQGFSVTFDQAKVDIWPAAMNSVMMSLTNQGRSLRTFEIQGSGLPDEYWRLSRLKAEVDPREPTHLLINFKPPRLPQTKPQRYVLSLKVIPSDQPDQAQTYELPVVVHGYGGFGVALARPRLELEETSALYLHNQGSEAVSIVLSSRSGDQALGARFSAHRLTLAAGERAQVIVTPQALSRPWFGQPRTHELFIEAQAQTAARWLVALPVWVEVPPRLKPWALWSMLGVAASLLLLALLALLGVFNPPTPQISALRPSAELLTIGEPLKLTWEAQNIAEFRLLVNDSPLLTLPGDQRSYTLDTSAYASGPLRLEIRDARADQLIAAQTSVALYRPLQAVSLSVTPLTVPRGVTTTLSIQWSAQGALEVRLEGLEQFSDQSATLDGAGGTFNVSGQADQPFDLILRASGERDARAEARQRITLTDPLCITRQPLDARLGPAALYPLVSALPTGQSLLALGRDAGGEWVQLDLAGVRAWGQANTLECQGFSPQNLPISTDYPPLPTPSATPTLRPTARPASPTPTTAPR